MKERPEISIIIRCFNEEKHIGRLLQDIMSQTRQDFEIIVVDSGSTDRTLDIALDFPVTILSVRPEAFSFGYALNYGCSHSRGRFLVFASAHVYPMTSSWLETLISMFSNPRVGLVFGKQRGNHATRYFEHRVFEKLYPNVSIPNKRDPFCNNANAAIRRELWERFKYDEELTGLEDLAWAKRIMAEGYHLAYSAEAAVVHVHEETAVQRYRRYEREAIALKRIFPDSHFSFRDFLWLYSSNCMLDLISAARAGIFTEKWLEILRCRWDQFSGTWSGYRFVGPLAQEMKMRFFYPAVFDGSSRSELVQQAEHTPSRIPVNSAQRIVALIPMRAESKRVPNKNIRQFNGKPLYFHIIRTMLNCPVIDEVVVDTNSPKIMEEIPKQFDRVTVIPRPENLCADTVPMNDVLLHDVQQVEADWYVQTHATNPLLQPETVARAVQTIVASTEHDSLFSVSPVLARFWDSAGRPVNHNPHVLLRTQDLAPIFEENSNLYIFRGETLKRLRNRIGERPLMYSIPKEEAWDIDEEIDFQIAEFLHARRATSGSETMSDPLRMR